MSRRKTQPLRGLTQEERQELEAISREVSGPAEWMMRAKILLEVNAGKDYQVSAAAAGRRDGDRVAALVKRFNTVGLRALTPRHGGGPAVKYGVAERERILREVARKPNCEQDGTAVWSLSTLQRALRDAEDGLPEVSEFTIRKVLLEGGYDWQHSRTWCQTGQVIRRRKSGAVLVIDPDS
jgi:hypothetical protein